MIIFLGRYLILNITEDNYVFKLVILVGGQGVPKYTFRALKNFFLILIQGRLTEIFSVLSLKMTTFYWSVNPSLKLLLILGIIFDGVINLENIPATLIKI